MNDLQGEPRTMPGFMIDLDGKQTLRVGPDRHEPARWVVETVRGNGSTVSEVSPEGAALLIEILRAGVRMGKPGARTLDDVLDGFPADWDVQVAVCCRGETFNGPPGVRRWTAVAVPKMPSAEEILAGALPAAARMESGCSETPMEAVMELAMAIERKSTST